MSIALVNSALAKATGPSTGCTTAAFNSSGATLAVLGSASWEGGDTPSHTDSASNTYSSLTAQSNVGLVECRITYCANPTTSATHTATVSGTNTYCNAIFSVYSGVLLASPFDQQNGNKTTSGAAITVGSITPTDNNELIVTIIGRAGTGGSETINESMTIMGRLTGVVGQAYTVAHAYKVQTTAAAINPTWTLTSDSGVDIAAAIASFKEYANRIFALAGNGGGLAAASRGLAA